MNELTNDQTSPPGFWGGLLNQASTPMGMGLLSAAFGGLAGARPGQLWNNLGRAGREGLLGYSMAQEREQQLAQQKKQGQMFDLQLKQVQQGQQDQTDLRNLAQQFYKPPTMTMDQVNAAPGQVGPTNARADLIGNTQPTFDTGGFINAYMAKDPLKAMQLRASLAKESQFDKFKPENYTAASVSEAMRTGDYSKLVRQDKLHFADTGGAVAGLNPFTGQQVASVDKSGNPFEDVVVRDAKGNLVPNAPLVGAKASIARAGAPSVSVRNDIKTGDSLATQVGPMVRESYVAAQGAAQAADSANRVIQASDTGKVITGPFANGQLAAGQWATTLGIGGKDTQESIANTRAAIRGLAELTLNGRKQMRGEGAITESEGKLAERAMSGDITMTAGEIRQLALASRRAAKWTYDQHQSQLGNMRQDPNLQGLSRFYNVTPFPESPSIGGHEIDFRSLK
jgi:hypothetical protein